MNIRFRLLAPLLGIVTVALTGAAAAPPAVHKPTAPDQVPAKVDYDRDVQPIISENCGACHGFDATKRQAGLRLDTAAGAFGKLPSGGSAIVPGKLKLSEVAQRITTTGPLQMPPASSNKKLTAEQILTIRRWINQGARYEPHWSFVAPKRPLLPPVHNAAWVHNPIDRFILSTLESRGMKPSPEADRATLLRRVSLDLTGIPPTNAELDAFLADKRPDAYERQVDRLLASPRYGERMALAWLDLARYADTHGYHIDSQRDMWRWRDWVIDAYNRNLPYDQFTIQQLAGDLLPNATLDQRIATGFNRNHPIDFEGGAIPEEYAAAYIEDRIDTTATTFMGLTMRCAQCHDHKYDPITQKEYYRFFAFFNNVPEQGLDGQKGNAVPFLKSPTPDQQSQLDQIDHKLADFEQSMKARRTEVAAAETAWESTALASLQKTPPVTAGLAAEFKLDETAGRDVHDSVGVKTAGLVQGKATWTPGPMGRALSLDGATYCDLGQSFAFERTEPASYGAWVYPTANEAMTVVSKMDDGHDFRGWDMYLGDGKVYVHMIHKWETNAIRVNTKNPVGLNMWHHLFMTYDGSSKAKGIHVYVDGKPVELDITHDALTDTIKTEKPLYIGKRNVSAAFKGQIADVRLYKRELTPLEVGSLNSVEKLEPILAIPAAKRTAEQQETIASYYLTNNDPTYTKLATDQADMKRQRMTLDAAIPTTMVMQEMAKPRDTFLLIRGQYDQHGEKQTAGTPAILPPLPAGVPNNRLGLAEWLVNPAHPLTARVAVNRYWQMYFGIGIVKTAENFGLQGERPSNQQLLDWLATEFIRTGWNVKGMQRLIVTSAAYRQSSRITKQLLEEDPENRFVERGPRFRLPAEAIRDQALALSGLLVEKLGGPSVKPYQPPGLWEEIAFGGGFSAQTYVQDHGDSLYRRSMYTFWKRTVPPAALQTFDAPEREFCMVRRSVTNTPLQALVLMNDPTYVEASRKFAERIMTEGGSTPEQRVAWAFRTATCRKPHASESAVLLDTMRDELTTFRANPALATKLLMVGESKRNEKLDASELAAWTAVASIIFNLDETITKS